MAQGQVRAPFRSALARSRTSTAGLRIWMGRGFQIIILRDETYSIFCVIREMEGRKKKKKPRQPLFP